MSTPWWWHTATPVFGLLIGGEMLLSDHATIAISVIAGMTLLAELVVMSLGRHRIIVADGKIRVGNWRLPLTQVRGVATLTADEMRTELRRRDPAVYRCTAPWIATGVMLDVDDPDDVPLWVVSTRRPDRLAAALAQESLAVPAPPHVPSSAPGP